MSDPREGIRKIANDLTSLEINTIIKPNMVGTKMPIPRHALVDLAVWYMESLNMILRKPPEERDLWGGREFAAGELKGSWRVQDYVVFVHRPEGKSAQDERKAHPGSYWHFDVLRGLARQRIDDLAKVKELSPEQESDLAMLFRIKDTSDQMKGTLNAVKYREGKTARKTPQPNAPDTKNQGAAEGWDNYNNYTREAIEAEKLPFALTTDELVTIRKAWDIGVERIAMQTVIQLDGDVMTRVSPEVATGKNKTILEIHSQGVSFSMKAWGDLVGLVKDFFVKITEFFAPKVST